MAINLVKGQRVEIAQGLSKLKVEMGWKVNPNAIPPYDLDASTFLLGNSGQIENEYDFFSMVHLIELLLWTNTEIQYTMKTENL